MNARQLTFSRAPPTYGVSPSASRVPTAATSSSVRMGLEMTGPVPAMMSNGMFMPVRGVRMSENSTTPSGLNACHG